MFSLPYAQVSQYRINSKTLRNIMIDALVEIILFVFIQENAITSLSQGLKFVQNANCSIHFEIMTVSITSSNYMPKYLRHQSVVCCDKVTKRIRTIRYHIVYNIRIIFIRKNLVTSTQ